MRITGGQMKGIVLRAPRGLETRPTSDKVREAVFQTLGGLVSGTRVLDLFAGSGALGIEAISRGADFCVFVEKDRSAVRVIADNIARAGMQDKSRIVRSDFRDAVKMLSRHGETFRLILLDPPYASDILTGVAATLAANPIVAQGGILVLEHFKKTTAPDSLAGITTAETRYYGQTAITYYRSS
ncbi:MAG: 16S rRNA (guanine(966)-N(2))-methyltransferase RsmD [Candidatus Abyssobacteria bacterium SURF_5]|uniref:16S rRNA (Guanine(966)-N(2))-methyltransferase RsmD n=1 Tax=Abyssobacteria bacterium (strain SURF_5) TaxID=2093360 RepID=A0A3A4NTI2_ABYX5|nr:MAG: 16S rRNA (guanine(966)-N(2))-methyltransferase RsmD [Candidatus Abyssubacteria bacterium SURF_5]